MMRSARRLAAAVAAGSMVVGGCTGGTDRAAERGSTSTASTSTIPPSCRAAGAGSVSIPPSSVPEACARQQFRVALHQPDNAAAAGLPLNRALLLARSLCAYAATLPDQRPAPTFDALMASNAKNWKVTPQAARAISRAAVVLCPDEIAAIYALSSSSRPMKVTYRLDGTGGATVTYTSGNDSFSREQVTAPWRKTVEASTTGVFSILATPAVANGAQLTCSVTIAGKQLDQASSDPTDAGMAACSVTTDAARRAVNTDK
jgi:hypothetical protein